MKLSAPELRLLRLQGQHLLAPAPREAVLADLCGLQAQLYPCALHGLRLRSGELPAALPAVRTWTLRGTLHLIREADLPLLIHRRGAPEEVCAFETYAFLCAHGRPLPPEYLRGIFNLTGMVFPALLIQGVTAGRWKLQPKALQLTAFRQLDAREREAVREEADRLFPGLAIELEQA